MKQKKDLKRFLNKADPTFTHRGFVLFGWEKDVDFG